MVDPERSYATACDILSYRIGERDGGIAASNVVTQRWVRLEYGSIIEEDSVVEV